jgi:hypothetical protein
MELKRRSAVGIIQRDWEQRVSDKADELAREKYQQDFCNLPPHLEMQVWMEAENLVHDQMDAELAAAQKEYRESGKDFWGELELERRLGN